MNLYDYADQLANADTEHQVESCLKQYLSHYGFSSFAFTYYTGHIKSGSKLRYYSVSESLRSWHLYYIDQSYSDVDRTLEENYLKTLPLFWDVQEQLKQAKNKREKRIRLESIEYGIDKGLSIPIHGPNYDFVSLTLHQRKNEDCLKHYLSQQYEWLAATHLFYHYIKKILDTKKEPKPLSLLTQREEQCIALTAQSWRVEQIAKELNITPRTVNFHLQNANKKLGVHNKYQATYKYFQIIES